MQGQLGENLVSQRERQDEHPRTLERERAPTVLVRPLREDRREECRHMECRSFRKGRAAFLLRKRKNRRFHLWEAVLVERAKGSEEMNTLSNIVLVHGAWADGSSWSAVIERLQADGYNVRAPQFPW